jgi:hypothetical protein
MDKFLIKGGKACGDAKISKGIGAAGDGGGAAEQRRYNIPRCAT